MATTIQGILNCSIGGSKPISCSGSLDVSNQRKTGEKINLGLKLDQSGTSVTGGVSAPTGNGYTGNIGASYDLDRGTYKFKGGVTHSDGFCKESLDLEGSTKGLDKLTVGKECKNTNGSSAAASAFFGRDSYGASFKGQEGPNTASVGVDSKKGLNASVAQKRDGETATGKVDSDGVTVEVEDSNKKKASKPVIKFNQPDPKPSRNVVSDPGDFSEDVRRRQAGQNGNANRLPNL